LQRWEDRRKGTVCSVKRLNTGHFDPILSQLLRLSVGEDVEIVYSSHAEIAQLIAMGTIQYAVDAQPYVTSN
jgi:hypothetical protein